MIKSQMPEFRRSRRSSIVIAGSNPVCMSLSKVNADVGNIDVSSNFFDLLNSDICRNMSCVEAHTNRYLRAHEVAGSNPAARPSMRVVAQSGRARAFYTICRQLFRRMTSAFTTGILNRIEAKRYRYPAKISRCCTHLFDSIQSLCKQAQTSVVRLITLWRAGSIRAACLQLTLIYVEATHDRYLRGGFESQTVRRVN